MMLMDGIISSSFPNECLAVIANFSHLPITIPANALADLLTMDYNMTSNELTNCLSINSSKPKATDPSHVNVIPLDHIHPTHIQC